MEGWDVSQTWGLTSYRRWEADFEWWKVLCRENKLYGLAGINEQDKNGGPKYMEYVSS
jgi:hypothetical protein